MDKPKKRSGEPAEVHYPPDEFADITAGWTKAVDAARVNTTMRTMIVHAAKEFAAPPTDTKTDTEKNEKKKRPMTDAARACAREYKRRARQGENPKMKDVVSWYVAENGGSEDSIYRTLTDNPGEWKTDK